MDRVGGPDANRDVVEFGLDGASQIGDICIPSDQPDDIGIVLISIPQVRSIGRHRCIGGGFHLRAPSPAVARVTRERRVQQDRDPIERRALNHIIKFGEVGLLHIQKISAAEGQVARIVLRRIYGIYIVHRRDPDQVETSGCPVGKISFQIRGGQIAVHRKRIFPDHEYGLIGKGVHKVGAIGAKRHQLACALLMSRSTFPDPSGRLRVARRCNQHEHNGKQNYPRARQPSFLARIPIHKT